MMCGSITGAMYMLHAPWKVASLVMAELFPWLASMQGCYIHPAVWKTCTYSEIRKKKLFPYRRKTWYIPSGNPAQDIHGKSLCLTGKSGKSSTNGGFSIAMSAVLVAAQPEQRLAFPDSADWISRVWKRFPCLRLGNLRTWEANQLSQPTLTISINYETIVITKI